MAQPTPLTGDQIYQQLKISLQNFQMDVTLFYQILSMLQGIFENERDWMILRKVDITQRANVGDTFQTPKSLPADFNRYRSESPIILYDPSNPQTYRDDYLQVPLEMQITYQNEFNRFFIDFVNNHLFLTGGVDRTYVIQQNYIYDTPDIAANTSWVFPARFHSIFFAAISAIWKGGLDFDIQNVSNVIYHDKMVMMILDTMRMWDSNLQVASLRGVQRGNGGGMPIQGGRVYDDALGN